MKINFEKVNQYGNATDSLIYAHAFQSISISDLIEKVKANPKIYKEEVLKNYLKSLKESALVSFKEGEEEIVDEYLKEN